MAQPCHNSVENVTVTGPRAAPTVPCQGPFRHRFCHTATETPNPLPYRKQSAIPNRILCPKSSVSKTSRQDLQSAPLDHFGTWPSDF